MKALSSFLAMSYAKDTSSSNFYQVLQKPVNRFISDLKSLAPCECAGSIPAPGTSIFNKLRKFRRVRRPFFCIFIVQVLQKVSQLSQAVPVKIQNRYIRIKYG
jgi:hypothetical protein